MNNAIRVSGSQRAPRTLVTSGHVVDGLASGVAMAVEGIRRIQGSVLRLEKIGCQDGCDEHTFRLP